MWINTTQLAALMVMLCFCPAKKVCNSEISIVLSIIMANGLWQFPPCNVFYPVLHVLKKKKKIITYANNFSLTELAFQTVCRF